MSSQIGHFSPYHGKLQALLKEYSAHPCLYEGDCSAVNKLFEGPADDLQNVFEVTQQGLRIIRIYTAGLQDNADFRKELEDLNLPSWKDLEAIDVAVDMQESLAGKLYNVKDPAKDIFYFEVGDKSRLVAEGILKRALSDGVPFSFTVRDDDFIRLITKYCDEKGVDAIASFLLEIALPATHRVVCYPLTPEKIYVPIPEPGQGHSDRYKFAIDAIKKKSGRGESLSTITFPPTRAEAQNDDIPYRDYCRLFFEMCDQPWRHISDAQEVLIEQFNLASHVRFTNDWGTDIEMELVDADGRNFTFCNSLIDKNVPGSEIFSAPRRDSINGRIVSYGRFHNDDSKMIENLRLHFTKGCLDTWGAERGIGHFTKFIERDPGNRYVGELGVGTNPHLKRHVSNGLLVEKIGGSFHLALGGAYEMTDYLGTPVHVDNGNRSDTKNDHWDITTMLHGAGGRIWLDGKQVMENGMFLDRRLDVLNRGWNAVSENEKPEYWNSHPTPFCLSI